MNVQQANREKKIAKFGVKLLRTKLGKRGTVESIHKYLESSGDGISNITKWINKTGNNIDVKYQRKRFIETAELGLWLFINHDLFRPMVVNLVNTLTKYHISENDLPRTELTSIEKVIINKVMLYTSRNIIEGRFAGIHADMMTCGNKAIRFMLDISLSNVESLNLDEDMQTALVVFIECGLWTMQGDTAYRDPFFWFTNKVGDSEIKHLIKQYPMPLVRHPKQWYTNQFLKGRKATLKGRKEGTLAPNQFSTEEALFVPGIQKRLLNQSKR